MTSRGGAEKTAAVSYVHSRTVICTGSVRAVIHLHMSEATAELTSGHVERSEEARSQGERKLLSPFSCSFPAILKL